MKLSMLVERVNGDWTVSLLEPNVATVMEKFGRRAAERGDGPGAFVISSGRAGFALFQPAVHVRLHEPDG
jgi:hypothetical protein